MQIRKSIVRLLLLSITVLISGCTKEDKNPIPECRVNLQTPYADYVSLKNPGTYKIYAPDGSIYAASTHLGYGGVLVFRDLEGKIRACDLACPVEARVNICVKVSMPYAICPVCHTKYDLSFGFCVPIEGESKHSLKIYDRVRDNGSYIIVTN